MLQVPLFVQESGLTKNKVKHGSDDVVSISQTTDISFGASGNLISEDSDFMIEVSVKFGSSSFILSCN